MKKDVVDAQMHLDRAQQALEQRRFTEAREHLNAAVADGMSQDQASGMFAEVAVQEMKDGQRRAQFGFSGLALGCVGYGLLSFTSPYKMSTVPWALVAFGVIPILVGFLSGQSCPAERSRKGRFFAGFGLCGVIAAVYAGINVSIARSALSTPIDPGAMTTIVCLVSVAVGVGAGLVAGIVSRSQKPAKAHPVSGGVA